MDLWSLQIPLPVALSLIAALGYLVTLHRRRAENAVVQQSRRELRRARQVARELENIAESVRKQLAAHHASLDHFKERIGRMATDEDRATWRDLCREAEEMLAPTMRLAARIAEAYDQIRQQSSHLMSFTELRTDPLTGISNRRALDDTLETQFALFTRYQSQFAVAMFDIDHFKRVNDEHGHLHGDRVLQDVARVIDETLRETDTVARFGGEEFLVVMPHTGLEGASTYAERLRATVAERLPVTLSGGVAEPRPGDTVESLLARADLALYAAKTAGRNAVHRHSGDATEPVVVPAEEAAVA